MDTVIAIIILAGLGIFAIFYSFRLLSGKGIKSVYMADHIYAGRVYTGIPLGIAALFFAAATIPQDMTTGLIIVYMGGGFGLLGLIFAFIQPSFLKPTWLNWLEHEHGNIMPLLRKEVREMGDKAWNSRIQTQADLEEWVAEVRCKHGLTSR